MNDDVRGQSSADSAPENGPQDAVPAQSPNGQAMPMPDPPRPRRETGTVVAIVAAAVVTLAVIGGGVAVYLWADQREHDNAAANYTPSATDKDPSLRIPGVIHKDYRAAEHVGPNQRVAYEQSPPMGGAHDANWAVCTGVVYPRAVRTENIVHDLEHGAVWIAYNPDRVFGDALKILQAKVIGVDGMVMSPYPGLDQPISLQSWGHQLKVSSAKDKRIDHFITALLHNPYTYPEPGATCSNPMFDVANPPPFDPAPPGPDAVPANRQPQSTTPSAAPAPGTPGAPGTSNPPGTVPGKPSRPG